MNFKKTVFKNGLRVVTIPMRDNPAVTVLVMVEAGSKYEPKNLSGISHFLEHMCFKGTGKRPKAINISRELDSIGSQYNAFTAQEFTGYYAKSDPKHVNVILDVVSDMYLNPIFEEKEIEKEKGVIIEEINMYEDLPYKHVHDLFTGLLYGDQPAGWNIAGTKDSVSSFKRQDFVDYRKAHYVASATVIVVAGQFDEAKILKEIEEKLVGIHEGAKGAKVKVIERQLSPQVVLKYKETDQTHLVIGVRTFDMFSAYAPALKVMSAILGGGMSSRLFQKLRDEMGVGYYVHASNDTFTDHGYFAVSAGVDNKRVKEVVSAIIEEFKKLKEDDVPLDELQKAKDYIVGNMYLGLESSDSVAEFYGYRELLKKEILRPEEVAERIHKVTGKEIKDVARLIFKNNGINLAVIGRFKENDEFLNILNID